MRRDQTGKAVINTDIEALNKYKQERTYYRKVDSLYSDVLEIKKSILSINERLSRLESDNKNG